MSWQVRFFEELRRRNVIRSGAAYLVLAWLILQVADILLDAFDAPLWIMQALIYLLAVGLPVALIFSWVFEITTSGIKRTEDVELGESIAAGTGRKIDFLIIGVLVVALSVSLYANFKASLAPAPSPERVSILIADLDNTTGNELFSGVLEETVRIGLEVAPFIDSFSRDDAKSILTREDSTRDDEGLGVDNAIFVGLQMGIDIVIGGSIDSTAEEVSVTLRGVQLPEQNALFQRTETVKSEGDVLEAVSAITQRLRSELGYIERKDDLNEETFATTSLEAAAAYVHAQRFQANRQLQEAIKQYDRAIELDPGLTRAYSGRALSKTYLGMSDSAKADWDFVIANIDRLDSRERQRTLIVYYGVFTKDWQKSLEAAERLVLQFPADSAGRNNVAVSAFYTRDFDRAREAGQTLMEQYPGVSLYRSNLALYSMYAGDFSEAVSIAFERSVSSGVNSYQIVAGALSALALGDRNRAVDAYQELLEGDDFARSLALEGLADLALYANDTAAAREHLDAGIRHDEAMGANDSMAIKHAMLAEMFIQEGDKSSALDHLLLGRELGSSDASQVSIALLLVRIGELDRAESIANSLANQLSIDRRAYADVIRASIVSQKGQRLIAIDMLNSSIGRVDMWLSRLVLGETYLINENIVEAFGELELCRERTGEGLSIFLNDRPTFRAIGRLETALQAAGGSRSSVP